MAKNDTVLLDGILDRRVSESFPSEKRDEVFEYLAFEQVLKDYDFSQEELESGWVDGRDDGGLDGIFTIVNGRLVQTPDSVPWAIRDAVIDVWLFTAKHHDTFLQKPLDTIYATLAELFDLSIADAQLSGAYSDLLLSARATFHNVYRKLAASATLTFRVAYASRGDTEQ